MQKIELETRYNRDAWLATAIEVLCKKGQAKLRTEHIAKALGVTPGSFCHHVKNRDEFVFALVDFWARTFIEQTNANLDEQELSADQRLLSLMRLIRDNRLDKYDIAFRSWAAQEPAVAEKVRAVDHLRL